MIDLRLRADFTIGRRVFELGLELSKYQGILWYMVFNWRHGDYDSIRKVSLWR